jgi:uncharacterized protein (DUF362 family)
VLRRKFLTTFAAAPLIAEESFTASATRDRTPQVGLIGSHFKGSDEMDGNRIPGLKNPAALNAELGPEQWDAMVTKAMDLGGRRRRRDSIRPDGESEDWLVILVRSGNGDEPGTDPGIVNSAVRQVAQRAKRITIARGGDARMEGWTPDWRQIASQSRSRVDFVDLNTDRWLEAPSLERPFARNNPSGKYSIARTILECDRIMVVAPMAIHPELGPALGAWNYWGIAPGAVYGYPKNKLRALGGVEDLLADLYLHKPPTYVVLGGPWAWNGKKIRHNVIAAGANPTAVETAASAAMGFDAAKVGYLEKLVRRGAGINDIWSVWTRGHETDEVLRDFRKGSQS